MNVINDLKWCPGADLNHRHADFQSAALPLSYPANVILGTASWPGPPGEWGRFTLRAPKQNRTADLLLTMETLCLLSYRGNG